MKNTGQRRRARSEESGYVDRIIAACLGGAAGGAMYISWSLWQANTNLETLLRFSGPIRWYVLAGIFIGALGGLGFARWLWEHAYESISLEATFIFWVALSLGAIVLLSYVLFKLGAA